MRPCGFTSLTTLPVLIKSAWLESLSLTIWLLAPNARRNISRLSDGYPAPEYLANRGVSRIKPSSISVLTNPNPLAVANWEMGLRTFGESITFSRALPTTAIWPVMRVAVLASLFLLREKPSTAGECSNTFPKLASPEIAPEWVSWSSEIFSTLLIWAGEKRSGSKNRISMPALAIPLLSKFSNIFAIVCRGHGHWPTCLRDSSSILIKTKFWEFSE